jgi:hypothetical protein
MELISPRLEIERAESSALERAIARNPIFVLAQAGALVFNWYRMASKVDEPKPSGHEGIGDVNSAPKDIYYRSQVLYRACILNQLRISSAFG